MRLHGVAWSASAQNMPAPLLEGSVGEAGDLFAGQRGAGSGCWSGQYWTVLKGSSQAVHYLASKMCSALFPRTSSRSRGSRGPGSRQPRALPSVRG